MPLTPAETERLYEIINLYTDSITEILKTIRDGLHTKETYQDDEEYITGFVHGCIITHYLLNLKYQYGRELKVDEKNFEIKAGLYTFNKKDLLNIISSCDDQVQKLMVFGHNPAMTGVVNELGDKEVDNIPTTGLTVIDFDVSSWKNISNGKTILNLFPKNLR